MNLFQILLVLFIFVPIFEIYLFITVGSFLGALPTIFLVIFTAILGAYLLRRQGLATIQKAQATMEQGQIPATALFEGILLLIGGALLLTPGFFTDTIGFMCLIPKVRQLLFHWLRQRTQVVHPGSPHDYSKGPKTINGEYRRED
ncbi:MAG: FxsA family protein [Candidatus Parabeggiatoa sp.]|nr:FxsA family protein [Candidatus Parabeggiatoa sp.]